MTDAFHRLSRTTKHSSQQVTQDVAVDCRRQPREDDVAAGWQVDAQARFTREVLAQSSKVRIQEGVRAKLPGG